MIHEQQDAVVNKFVPASSLDGLVRLSLDGILSIHLRHLISGIDAEEHAGTGSCGCRTVLSGYTEWIGDTEPALTMGWDWSVESHGGTHRWVRTGPPRSNIMLIDKTEQDLGWEKNLAILATFVDAMAWAEQAKQAIAIRYT